MTLLPWRPQPASWTEKAEDPNTGSLGPRLTSARVSEAGAQTGDSEAGSWTETRDTGTEVSCSSRAEAEPNRDWKGEVYFFDLSKTYIKALCL